MKMQEKNKSLQTTMLIVFLDGQSRIVSGETFSVCCAKAAYSRVLECACTHKELTADQNLSCILRSPITEINGVKIVRSA